MRKKKIDELRTRRALKNLERIAKERPGLLGDSTPKEWLETLEREVGKSMSNGRPLINQRMPQSLLDAVNALVEDLTEEVRQTLPTMKVTRTEVINMLIKEALEERGYEVEEEQP